MMAWNWYLFFPVALSYGVTPVAAVLFYCGFFGVRARWFWCAAYTAGFGVLAFLESRFHMTGSPGLVMEILLLACIGKCCLKRTWAASLAAASLVLAIREAADGFLSWIDQRLFFPLILNLNDMICAGDGIRELLTVLLAGFLFWLILKKSRDFRREFDEKILSWLAVPTFFLSMTERIIRNSIYGDRLVVDADEGLFGAVVDINHGEMLFLQIFACLCLFLSLIACGKIMTVVHRNQQLHLLEQQIQIQEVYVQEAHGRLEKTRGFRHDIKNHLTVLSELLREGQTEEARRYLSALEQFSQDLSGEVWTGNAAVSALLGSKLSAARQRGIRVRCEVAVPENIGIGDMDLCVVLSNGIDNAVKACQAIPEEKRYLEIKSRKKANFYLMSIENSCSEELKEAPEDGIGLSNIRAVAEKYEGKSEKEVSDGVYRLKVLLTTKNKDSAPYRSGS